MRMHQVKMAGNLHFTILCQDISMAWYIAILQTFCSVNLHPSWQVKPASLEDCFGLRACIYNIYINYVCAHHNA